MDRDDALRLLRQGREGVKRWNEWREKNRDIAVDLSGVDLSGCDLQSALLDGVDLSRANLEAADHRRLFVPTR